MGPLIHRCLSVRFGKSVSVNLCFRGCWPAHPRRHATDGGQVTYATVIVLRLMNKALARPSSDRGEELAADRAKPELGRHRVACKIAPVTLKGIGFNRPKVGQQLIRSARRLYRLCDESCGSACE